MTDAGHNLASRVHGFNGGLEWSITNKVDCCSMSPRHKQGIKISGKGKRVKFDGMGKIFNGVLIQHFQDVFQPIETLNLTKTGIARKSERICTNLLTPYSGSPCLNLPFTLGFIVQSRIQVSNAFTSGANRSIHVNPTTKLLPTHCYETTPKEIQGK